MEHVRSFSANALRARIGVDFGFDTLQTEGLRSLRVQGLHFDMPVPGLGQVSLNVEALQLTLSLSELFRGRAVIGQAEISGARLVVDGTTKTAKRAGTSPARSQIPFGNGPIFPQIIPKLNLGTSRLAALPPVRLLGNDCAIEFRAAADTPPIVLDGIAFRFSNNPDLSEAKVEVTANSTAEDVVAVLTVEGAFRLPDILTATIEIENVAPAHLRPFIAVPEGVDGRLSVRARAYGMSNQQVMAEVAAEVSEANIPNAPPNIEKLSGAIRASVQWDAAAKKIYLRSAMLDTSLANANAQGSLNLAQEPPIVDITATIGDIPVETLLSAYLPEEVARLGEMTVDVSPDAQITVRASGTLNALETEARVFVPTLSVALIPADKTLPQGEAHIEQINLVWRDVAGMPVGTANLVNGTVSAPAFDIEAAQITGMVAFDGDNVSLRPITAMIVDKPWSGAAAYGLSTKELTFDVNGTLTNIEKTPLHDMVNKLWLGGEIAARARGVFGPEGRLRLQGNADVTRGMVAFEWWLRKPIGVGASIHNIEVDMIPGKSLVVQGEASLEDTRIVAKLDYVYADGKFHNRHLRVDVPHLEVNSAGKCIQIPYTAFGSACRDGYYESNRTGALFEHDIAVIGGFFDYISFLPDGGENPLICRDATVEVTLVNHKRVERSAALVVHAAEAHVPPFGDDWLLPLGPPDDYEEDDKDPDAPDLPQPWTYTLSADKIYVPPWEGSNLAAEMYSNEEETGFVFFRADVGNGRLEGKHRHEKEDNVMHLEATWEAIPAAYIIRHLELPEVLAGDITGNIAYVVDQDDPRTTMRADGQFTVTNGHFIPEALAFMLADTLGSSFIALHPNALTFKEVSSTVRIEGDKIHTSELVMDSEGMRLTGNGVWVMEGDLDYRIDVAITPDLADQIPLLRDYFNVQGFRMTQQNIELGFQLTGPTSHPTGQLAGLPPIGVTIVSGAAEMTGEAIRLLDTPRQMFMSIFRIGGGILGTTRTQQQQQQPRQ